MRAAACYILRARMVDAPVVLPVYWGAALGWTPQRALALRTSLRTAREAMQHMRADVGQVVEVVRLVPRRPRVTA